MVLELRVRRPDDGIQIGPFGEDDNGLDAFGGTASDRGADDRGFTDARLLVERPLHVLGKDVQPSGVTIISFLRPRM